MIMNTHTNAKVLTREYQRTLARCVISRDRVSPQQAEWLDVPPSVGNGAYDNEARGWMDTPAWDGSEHRHTFDQVPGKGARP